MKRMLSFIVFSLLLNTSTALAQMASPDSEFREGLAWGCYIKFAGVSKGLQVIFGKFHTEAVGNLICKSIYGDVIEKDVKISIQSRLIGLTVGAGYFQLEGISSEISLLHESPEKIFGDYEVTHYEAAVGKGLGYFSAVKVGLPQLAYGVSLQFLTGAGLKVGIEKMTIAEIL